MHCFLIILALFINFLSLELCADAYSGAENNDLYSFRELNPLVFVTENLMDNRKYNFLIEQPNVNFIEFSFESTGYLSDEGLRNLIINICNNPAFANWLECPHSVLEQIHKQVGWEFPLSPQLVTDVVLKIYEEHYVDFLETENVRLVTDIFSDKIKYNSDSLNEWQQQTNFYFINLDYRTDRLFQFLDDFKESRLPFNNLFRVNAYKDLEYPTIGCTKSHIRTLYHFIHSPKEYAIILEDDFYFENATTSLDYLNEVFKFSNLNGKEIRPFDIFFLSNDVLSNITQTKPYQSVSTRHSKVVRVLRSSSSVGYVLSRKFAEKLLHNYIEGLSLLQQMYDPIFFSLDKFWFKMMKSFLWLRFENNISGQRPGYLDIAKDIPVCTKTYVSDIWRLKPVGESYLENVLTVIHSKYGNELHYPTKLELFQVLYHSESSPYADVRHETTDILNDSYISLSQMNAKMLQEFVLKHHDGKAPSFMIEVGTFVGSGAVHAWGPLVKANSDGIVLCVDTWEGDISMRLSPEFQGVMTLEHGFPTLYKKFIERVKANSMDDVIFPLPMASLTAGRLLSVLNWIVDVVYLDSSHEIGETFAELNIYFQLLRPGGILMGSEYDLFPAVKHDVDLFVKYKSESLKFYNLESNQWAILKN